ncbi:MAG: HAD family hydrolase [Actinomycetota bacterium]
MRLVATDLDGTVVRPDGTISARTLKAFAACAEAGVDVVYVTGRPPRWLGQVVEQTGHSGTAICGNGAVVYDLAAERVISSRTMTGEVVLDVAARLTAASPGIAFAVETLQGFGREPGYVARFDGHEGRALSLPELVAGDDVVKLLCRNESSSGDAMLEVARAALDGVASPTHSNPHDCLVEVSRLGVSKAVALAELAAERGFAQADVIAFGDMPNDIEMLRWAGRGYAMADGHPDAIEAADDTAPPLGQDGVAQVLERLLA